MWRPAVAIALLMVAGCGSFLPERSAQTYYRFDDGALVLEAEIDVAGGRGPLEARHLATHPHVAIGVLDGLLERRRQLGDGPFRQVDAALLVHRDR